MSHRRDPADAERSSDDSLSRFGSIVFWESLSDRDVSRLLALALSEGGRPIDRLRARLEEPDSEAWVRESLEGRRVDGDTAAAILGDPSRPLEDLRRLKRIAKRSRREAADAEGRTRATLVYFLVLAAGLARHGELLTSRAADDVRAALGELGEALHSPWRELLREAARVEPRVG